MRTKYIERVQISDEICTPLFKSNEIGDVLRSINKSHKELGLRRSWVRPGVKKPPTFVVNGKDIRL